MRGRANCIKRNDRTLRNKITSSINKGKIGQEYHTHDVNGPWKNGHIRVSNCLFWPCSRRLISSFITTRIK